jgi:F-type H+-transporting ATPase subunit b
MTLDWWTLGIQAVNALILVWLLRRFFWGPVAEAIARRRAEATAMLADAKAKQAEAARMLAEVETTRAGFAAERDAILAAAQVAATNARAAALATAKAEADALREDAKVEIARVAAAAAKTRTDQVAGLAVNMASRLAARLDGPAVREAFLGWLVGEIRAMPETARQAVGRSNGDALELVSAAALDPAEQARVAGAVARAFGGSPAITFAADPTLIAGYELRGPYFSLRNSWRADLDRIREDLRDDG